MKGRRIPSCPDYAGNTLVVGSLVEFMTLYGSRTAVVKAIFKDRDPLHKWRGAAYLSIDPMQVGPESAFKPITDLRVISTYGPKLKDGKRELLVPEMFDRREDYERWVVTQKG